MKTAAETRLTVAIVTDLRASKLAERDAIGENADGSVSDEWIALNVVIIACGTWLANAKRASSISARIQRERAKASVEPTILAAMN